MAGAVLNLPALQAIIALGGYGGRGDLSVSTAVIGLSAALFLHDLSIWRGAGATLTDDEIDDIDAMVSLLESELMTSEDDYPMDRCKITSSAQLTIPNNQTHYLPFDTEVYDPQDMHSVVSLTEEIVISNAGMYLIGCHVTFFFNLLGVRALALYKYDTTIPGWINIAYDQYTSNAQASVLNLRVSIQDIALVGDKYKIYCYQNSGGNLNLYQNTFSPYFFLLRL